MVGCSLIKGIFGFNEQVMSRRFTTNLEDDVTVVYKIKVKMQSRNFSKVLKIDMNKFKSIWRLMLGILPPGVNRLGEEGLSHDGCFNQRPMKTRMVAL